MNELERIYDYPTARESILAEKRTESEVERIVLDGGIFIYLKGHPYPHKGMPTPEAVFAVNQAKRLLMQGLRTFGIWLIVVPRWKLLRAYTQLAIDPLRPIMLKYEYLTPQAQEVQRLISGFEGTTGGEYDVEENARRARGDEDYLRMIALGKIAAHIIEYDGAYRFRFMDLAGEVKPYALYHRPIREIRRVLAIHRRRDYKVVRDKFQLAGLVLCAALLLPSVRKRFKGIVAKADWSKLVADEGDRYWMEQKLDYHYKDRGVV